MSVFFSGGVYVCQKWYDTDSADLNAEGSTTNRAYKVWRKGQLDLHEDDVVIALAAATPLLLGSRIRRNIKLNRMTLNMWSAEITWETFRPQDHNVPGYEEVIRGSTSGQTASITQALDHVASFEELGEVADAAYTHEGALNVSQNNGKTEIKPIDIVVPSLEFTIDRSFPPNTISDDYISTLYSTTGKVNDSTFRGFQAGELLFTGADFVLNDLENETVSFQFVASPNVINYKIGAYKGEGGITISKKGHEYIWTEHKTPQKTAPDGKKQVKAKLHMVHVEKVYEEADFSLLGI